MWMFLLCPILLSLIVFCVFWCLHHQWWIMQQLLAVHLVLKYLYPQVWCRIHGSQHLVRMCRWQIDPQSTKVMTTRNCPQAGSYLKSAVWWGICWYSADIFFRCWKASLIATRVVLVVVVVVTPIRKMPKALLISNGKLRNFAYTFVTSFPWPVWVSGSL